METWFSSPTYGVVSSPAQWKMWLPSAAGIYPIITAVTVVAGPQLAELPALVRFAAVTPVLSAVMTWLVMPALSRLFAPLLYQR